MYVCFHSDEERYTSDYLVSPRSETLEVKYKSIDRAKKVNNIGKLSDYVREKVLKIRLCAAIGGYRCSRTYSVNRSECSPSPLPKILTQKSHIFHRRSACATSLASLPVHLSSLHCSSPFSPPPSLLSYEHTQPRLIRSTPPHPHPYPHRRHWP